MTTGPRVFAECRQCGEQLADGIITVRDGCLDLDSPLCNDCIHERDEDEPHEDQDHCN